MVELNNKLEIVKTQTDALIQAFHLATSFIMAFDCECSPFTPLCERCGVILDINAVLEDSHGTN